MQMPTEEQLPSYLAELGATYEANKTSPGAYSMGEARLDMAIYMGAESWRELTSEQRDFALRHFEEGREREAQYHRD